MTPWLNIVLLQPEIPQNTGSIGRICVNLNARLHLVKPLGFTIDEKKIKRAGMDYWNVLDLKIHDSWQAFFETENPQNFHFLSTKTSKTIFDTTLSFGHFLIFGNESHGLPVDFYQIFNDKLITLPMIGQHARSQNLANSVAVTAYEAYRQICHQKG
ncbi:MAG: tRNA (cytidine(34)-2'-O)-methyltransferase [Lentisphaeria bacterium]